MLRRRLGWVKGFITRRAQARTRQDYHHRVLVDRTGATLSMRLPIGKYTAVGEAAAEGLWVRGCYWRRLLRFRGCFNVSYWRHRRGGGEQGHRP